jgi:hypothetical protein
MNSHCGKRCGHCGPRFHYSLFFWKDSTILSGGQLVSMFMFLDALKHQIGTNRREFVATEYKMDTLLSNYSKGIRVTSWGTNKTGLDLGLYYSIRILWFPSPFIR